jgi:hypothetical protein
LPDRTYVFGRWEKRLLVERSVYRSPEVVVAGSPRLDLGRDGAADGREAVRSELGVASRDRMLVVSTTLAPAARRFGIAPLVAAVLDRPLPDVHLVFKLHPGEIEDDLYSRLVSALGMSRGFETPPVTVVKEIDLYRLLGAADGHLGLYSTVLTEAVVVGTRNFVGAISRSADLLGYVEAGVARPVHNGADLLAGLDAPPPDPEARRRFVEEHFEPGSASGRIRDDLLAWLAPGARSG